LQLLSHRWHDNAAAVTTVTTAAIASSIHRRVLECESERVSREVSREGLVQGEG
jgi:hypothetical protein